MTQGDILEGYVTISRDKGLQFWEPKIMPEISSSAIFSSFHYYFPLILHRIEV